MSITSESVGHGTPAAKPCRLNGPLTGKYDRNGSAPELPDRLRRLFESARLSQTFSRGSLLFVEGQPATRVFAVRSGRIKLSVSSRDGKVIVLRIAEAGDVLALASAIAGAEHDTTAETLEECCVDVLRQKDLLVSLERDPQVGLEVVRQLSRRLLAERQLIASMASADSVFIRLARLFLGWSENGNGGLLHLKNVFTHQQIAEMIGTSRETVTCTVREMRERQLVTLKGENLVIHDRARLQLITSR